MNLNSNGTFGSRARRLTRRLSYGISKALSWKSETTDLGNFSKNTTIDEQNPRIFDIDELVNKTKFTKSEIQFIYRDFKLKCPDGILTEKNLVEIYSQLFSCGDCTIYSKHLFSALLQQSSLTNYHCKQTHQINFMEFLITLSQIMRGSIDEKIQWLFNFYDVNKDGKITNDEIASMVRSLYDLMGSNVTPPVDENTKNQHIENVFKKLNIDEKSDSTMSYEEFYNLFYNNVELIETMMNVF